MQEDKGRPVSYKVDAAKTFQLQSVVVFQLFPSAEREYYRVKVVGGRDLFMMSPQS